MRRRRASAASSVSRRSLGSSLRLPLCLPLASLLPLPELRRVPATLGAPAGTKEGPRGGGSATPARGSYPRPARGSGSRASGSPGFGPAPLRRRRAQARLLPPARAGRKIWLRRLTRPQGPCCVVQDVAFMGILGQMECVLFATKSIFRGSRIVAE